MAIRASWFSEETPIICWAWSIRPLVIWLRLIGVHLPNVSSETSSTVQRYNKWLIWLYGAFCFLLFFYFQIDFLYKMNVMLLLRPLINERNNFHVGTTTTAIWNTVIDLTNYTVHGIGCHLILLTAIRVQWIDTMEKFQRLNVIFTAENYIRIRKMSICCVIYVILLVSTITFFLIDCKSFCGTSSTDLFSVIIAWIPSLLYPLTTIVAFVVHCYASSLAFDLIGNEIKCCESQLINGRLHDVSLLLNGFKQKHVAACDTVDSINNTFGWALLLSTTFFFVAIINVSYAMFTILDDDVRLTLAVALYLVYPIVNLLLICFASDHICNKAENTMKVLMRMKCVDEPLKSDKMEMEFLILMDMAQTIPQINASGYLKISKRLIPQVIGTTLTYFFILYQFDASEKKP